MKIIVTGGAGFIGSALIRHIIKNTDHEVMNVDSLTYAGNLDSLKDIESSHRYQLNKVDICDKSKIQNVFLEFQPEIVMHLAAETHVDRSIENPNSFINTNILGTLNLLECSREYISNKKTNFLFHHISTDEVYGDLEDSSSFFSESTSYSPSSPYSASKASSDHFVRAWFRTFKVPALITNCSNNYGPYHFPEKLIPHMILNALKGKSLPIYGNGMQIRDWLYVDDHVKALLKVATEGKVGETYNIGGHNEKTNIEVVNKICELLDELCQKKPCGVNRFSELITYVDDRPGHDKRYAIDASKIKNELGWVPEETFESGLRKTVKWYIDNQNWWERVLSGDYKLDRMGLRL